MTEPNTTQQPPPPTQPTEPPNPNLNSQNFQKRPTFQTYSARGTTYFIEQNTSSSSAPASNLNNSNTVNNNNNTINKNDQLNQNPKSSYNNRSYNNNNNNRRGKLVYVRSDNPSELQSSNSLNNLQQNTSVDSNNINQQNSSSSNEVNNNNNSVPANSSSNSNSRSGPRRNPNPRNSRNNNAGERRGKYSNNNNKPINDENNITSTENNIVTTENNISSTNEVLTSSQQQETINNTTKDEKLKKKRNNNRNKKKENKKIENNSSEPPASPSSNASSEHQVNKFTSSKIAGSEFGAFSRKTFNVPKDDINPPTEKKKRGGKPKGSNSLDLVAQGYSELTEDIANQLISNNYECMICYDSIKRQAPTWNCTNCYKVFHLGCIKKWSKSSQSEQTAGNYFRCPGCQKVQDSFPSGYFCFCGKVEDPQYNAFDIPHSCGLACDKVRENTQCPHKCNQLCHPGPCPPCSNFRIAKCFCGRSEFKVRCSDPDSSIPRSCKQVCGKLLNCGRHTCEQLCHDGDCGKCSITYEQSCFCGKQQEIRPCTLLPKGSDNKFNTFSCENLCNKKLECGNHLCEEICHLGPCKPCQRQPNLVKTCACGKTSLKAMPNAKPRTSCTDPIPICAKVCGKLLKCKVHKCSMKCHDGPCEECMETVCESCACTKTVAKFPCFVSYYQKDQRVIEDKALMDKLNQIADKYPSYPFNCNKVCNVFKSCGRHRCTNVCCASHIIPYYQDSTNTHICQRNCGKLLQCGIHNCDMNCHQNACPPCPLIINEPITCKCGAASLRPPLACGTKPPSCKQLCSIIRPCGHAQNHTCHADGECPPCTAPTDKMCSGNHMIVKQVPCCCKTVSCGKVCGKLLGCKLHTCLKECHAGKCEAKNSNTAENGCGQACGKVFPCGHKDVNLCHPKILNCNTEGCIERVTVYCPCKHRSQVWDCKNIRRTLALKEKDRKSNELWKRVYEIIDTQTLPPLLPCDEECRRLERNRVLADALKIDPTNKAAAALPVYSSILLDFASNKANLPFLKHIEKIFEDLARNLESEAVYRFPPMNGEKRIAIHELGKVYGFDIVMKDHKPYRSADVIRKITSVAPPILFTVYLDYPNSPSDAIKFSVEERKKIRNQQNEIQKKSYVQMKITTEQRNSKFNDTFFADAEEAALFDFQDEKETSAIENVDNSSETTESSDVNNNNVKKSNNLDDIDVVDNWENL